MAASLREENIMISLPLRLLGAALLVSLTMFQIVRADSSDETPLNIDLDLSKSFDTHAPWHFRATQEPNAVDGNTGEDEPGLVHLCLQANPSAACEPWAVKPQSGDPSYAEAWAPHYLDDPTVVYIETTKTPLLLLRLASLHSGNGDQLVYTQLLAYDRAADRFRLAYARDTGHNNNQEVRFIVAGPLQGDVISVEPTEDAPFGYWVTVSALKPTLTYEQVLHYRSATRYGDGNPLAVIDAEMQNIQQHLGLWHTGQPLPLPAEDRSKPHLVKQVLWCN
ncbi:MAG TPA: hypothetical protein VN229_17735 [Terriglobales bacterium]|nr:hypothetical protein [Terriglobales bacterium]